MGWQPAETPAIKGADSCRAIDMVIVPRTRDLGDFKVGRVLPSAKRRMVGPFIFFDQMGPVVFPAGKGIDVRPHPHIGLATVTYLLQGTIVHRDSIGSLQPITPGAVNWMTAGRGIAHSERSDAEIRKAAEDVFGFQIWVALPERHEETAPAFVHHPVSDLPTMEGDGVRLRLVAGTLFGKTSPVETLSDLFYADAALDAGASLSLPPEYEERAIYLVSGDVEIDGTRFEPGRMLVVAPKIGVAIRAATPSRILLLGGEPMDGPRHIWWNFVSSSKQRIEQAKDDWRNRRFAIVAGDEKEFIPLPDGP
jgi:redox-sensitive bicupin YhaK (pirin superfamily)